MTDPAWAASSAGPPRRPRPAQARPPASALLTTSSSGRPSAPISARTVRTASTWPSKSGAEPSTTWTMRSDSPTTSRVERKASTTWWGSLRTNPTVSVTSTVSPPGRSSCRVRGSRVENSRFSTRTSEPHSRLSRVDFPALVYPTSDTVRWRDRARPLRWVRRVRSSWRRSASSRVIRRTRRRRSTSSLVSPGPRVPIPPACWLKRPAPAPQPGQPVAEQGQLDLGPAFGGAGVLGEDVEDHRGAVDGRATQDLLEVALLGRREVVVEDHGVGIDGQAHRQQLLGLAPTQVGGRVGRGPALHDPLHHVGAGRVHQQGQLVQAGLGVGQRGVGEGHPDQHDALPDRPGDEGVGERRVGRASRPGGRPGPAGRSTSIVGHLAGTGPLSTDPVAPQSTPGGCPPGCARPPSSPTRPQLVGGGGGGRAAGAAGPGLPHPPLPHPEGEGVGTGAHGDELDVDPPGVLPLERRSQRGHVDVGRDRDRGAPGGGCPCRPGGPVGRRTCGGRSGPRPAPPMSTEAPAEPRPPPARYSTVRTPARVATVNVGGCTRPAPTAAWARQRMPLPLISATPPSALREVHGQVGPVRPGRRPGSPRRRRRRTGGRTGRGPASGSRACRSSSVHQHQEVVAGPVVLGQVEGSGVVASAGAHGAASQSPTLAPASGTSPKRAAIGTHRVVAPGPTTRYGDRGGTTPSAAGRRPGSAGRPGRRRRSSGRPSSRWARSSR